MGYFKSLHLNSHFRKEIHFQSKLRGKRNISHFHLRLLKEIYLQRKRRENETMARWNCHLEKLNVLATN